MEIDPQKIDSIIRHWKGDASFVIEMMQDVQDAYRHLPREALERVGKATGADLARLYHIATFYKAFSLEPRGEFSVQVCVGTACHVRGAARSMDGLARELGIAPGETTPDLLFTLEGVRCLGCCSLAPVVAVGPDLHGDLDSSKVRALVKKYRKRAAQREANDA
ncbi:MAG: NAD(P)H-dependent oxidoreductase subunit E [bacterium]